MIQIFPFRPQHLAICLLAWFTGLHVWGDIQWAALFGEHMVLQCDKPVRVWGTGDAGEKVVVQFRGKRSETKVGKDGKWALTLPAMAPSEGPESFSINDTTWKDVVVGEVWLGSGQSNLYLPAKADYFKKDELLQGALAKNKPLLRMYQPGRGWRIGNKKEFSALMGGFGHILHTELGKPVGLLVYAQGGSSTRPWLTWEMLTADAYAAPIIEREISTYPEKLTAYRKAREEKTSGWRAKKEPRNPDLRIRHPKDGKGHDLGMHYAKIAPMASYTIRGVLWDQGESDDAIGYLSLFDSTRILINGWRNAWGDETIPWIIVQKPSGGGCSFRDDDPLTEGSKPFSAAGFKGRISGGDINWMARTIKLAYFDDVYMVNSSDLCGGLHPWNKWGYAHRAADIALKSIYEKGEGPMYGPRYAGHEMVGGKCIVRFDNVGAGLEARHHEKVLGFFLGDEGNKYLFPAEAVIDEDTVVVTSSRIKNPTKKVAYY